MISVCFSLLRATAKWKINWCRISCWYWMSQSILIEFICNKRAKNKVFPIRWTTFQNSHQFFMEVLGISPGLYCQVIHHGFHKNLFQKCNILLLLNSAENYPFAKISKWVLKWVGINHYSQQKLSDLTYSVESLNLIRLKLWYVKSDIFNGKVKPN